MFKESADLAAQLNNFPHAIRRYEQVRSSAVLEAKAADTCRAGNAELRPSPATLHPRPVLSCPQIATTSLQSPLTRYSVKEYYLKAGLCHLCTGVSPRLRSRACLFAVRPCLRLRPD